MLQIYCLRIVFHLVVQIYQQSKYYLQYILNLKLVRDYQIISKVDGNNPFYRSKNISIILKIRRGHKWREEPGPLKLVATGSFKFNGDEGVIVAQVQADLFSHGVTVESTYSSQYIYHDDQTILIKGKGFNTSGNILRFSNGILGKGVNYTTVHITPNNITLQLMRGSLWRKNVQSLPGILTLLAVNAGNKSFDVSSFFIL